jgi:hypothetical protein
MGAGLAFATTAIRGYLGIRRAGKIATDASRDTVRRERREQLYLGQLVWGADYLADRPIGPDQVANVDRDARLAVYASKDVKA